MDQRSVSEAVASLRKRILQAGGTNVALVGVTKTFGSDAWRFAKAAGCDAVGENYAQELLAKIDDYRATQVPGDILPEVHFVGRLQSNKIRQIADVVSVWQTIDRDSVLQEVALRSPGAHIFIQVNASKEIEKGGCPPDQVERLLGLATQRGLTVKGLMTVGPSDGDTRRTAEVFAEVVRLGRQFGLEELSMGMTNDLEIAIDAGSTLIRVGSAIFGDRPPIA